MRSHVTCEKKISRLDRHADLLGSSLLSLNEKRREKKESNMLKSVRIEIYFLSQKAHKHTHRVFFFQMHRSNVGCSINVG